MPLCGSGCALRVSTSFLRNVLFLPLRVLPDTRVLQAATHTVEAILWGLYQGHLPLTEEVSTW